MVVEKVGDRGQAASVRFIRSAKIIQGRVFSRDVTN